MKFGRGFSSFNEEFEAHRRMHRRVGMVVVGIFVLVALMIVGGIVLALVGDGPENQSYAEAEARRYGATLYPGQPLTVTCQGADTDRNGYVSCTLVVGTGAPMSIECANRYAVRNEGCRPMRYPVIVPYGR